MAEHQDLSRKRCLNHPAREAAARCPECLRYFCRECVTEHGDRAICAACLRRLAREAAAGPRRRLAAMGRGGRLLVGILAAWFFFYLLGQALLSRPDRFHETTMGPAPEAETSGGSE